MNCNMRVLVGMAAILLVAVVFAQPSLGSSATETYTSLAGMGDMTTYLTNPNFEQDVVTAGDGHGLANTFAGWSLNNGSSGSMTYDPSGTQIYGAGGRNMPMPILPEGLGSPSCIPPVGYSMVPLQGNGPVGSQVLAVWKNAFIAQTIKNPTDGNVTTASNQTYVMTWEYGALTDLGNAWGWTVGIFYSSSSAYMQINNDTNFDAQHSDGHYAENNGYMYQYSWSFATGSTTGKTMTVRLGGGTTSGTGYNYFDNVHIYGKNATGIIGSPLVTPEPTTVALLVTGALGMLAYAWRRKRRK